MEVSKQEFQKLIKSLINKDPNNLRRIADHCGTSLPTVRRWAEGKNSPHYRIRTSAYKSIKKTFKTG